MKKQLDLFLLLPNELSLTILEYLSQSQLSISNRSGFIGESSLERNGTVLSYPTLFKTVDLTARIRIRISDDVPNREEQELQMSRRLRGSSNSLSSPTTD